MESHTPTILPYPDALEIPDTTDSILLLLAEDLYQA
jgi:hypothetical protein